MDDLGPADHLFQLVDPAVDQADLFFCLLIFRVVLDVTRLEGLLEPVGRFHATGALVNLLWIGIVVLAILWLLFHATGALVNLLWIGIVVLAILWLVGLFRGRSTRTY